MLPRYGALLATIFFAAAASAQAPATLTADDTREIQALSARYLKALGACNAEEYADLFIPDVGYFASRYRGQIVGRERLLALVQSERRCVAPAGTSGSARLGGSNGSAIELEATAEGARGVTDLGEAGQYHDEYVLTPDGWRFASRTALKVADMSAGIGPSDMRAIQRLAAPDLPAFYAPDQSGIERLRVAGVAISTTEEGAVRGRAYVKGGGFNDDIYEKTGAGKWRIKSRTFVANTR